MTQEFKLEIGAYLEDIEMPITFRDRALMIYDFYLEICPEEITGVFVSDYLNKDGTRQYENLWFFSESYSMEAKQFRTKDDFDITPTKIKIRHLRIQKKDYDFKNAAENSKINVFFVFEPQITADFKASKKNCDYLKKIISNHLIPNLMK